MALTGQYVEYYSDRGYTAHGIRWISHVYSKVLSSDVFYNTNHGIFNVNLCRTLFATLASACVSQSTAPQRLTSSNSACTVNNEFQRTVRPELQQGSSQEAHRLMFSCQCAGTTRQHRSRHHTRPHKPALFPSSVTISLTHIFSTGSLSVSKTNQ